MPGRPSNGFAPRRDHEDNPLRGLKLRVHFADTEDVIGLQVGLEAETRGVSQFRRAFLMLIEISLLGPSAQGRPSPTLIKTGGTP